MKFYELLNEDSTLLEKEGGWWDRNKPIMNKYKKISNATKIEDRKKAEATALMFVKETGSDGLFDMQQVVDWLINKNARVHNVVLDRNFMKKYFADKGITNINVNTPPSPSKKQPTAKPTAKPTSVIPNNSATTGEWKTWATNLKNTNPDLYNKLRKVMRWKI